MTLEDRLERLAGRTPPGDPTEIMAAARTRAESRTDSRSPRLLAAAAAVLAVVALVAGGFALLGDDGSDAVTVAGPNGADTESQVAVPESGALAQQLADGTPVWVVRHGDGSVSVVDAVSTHRPFGAGTLVGWCESSRGFLDPMYGSLYDEHGRKQAGPSPRGLDEYRVASVDGDTATVTGAAVEQPRAEDGGPEADEPAGPHCFHTDGDYDPGVIEGSFESHAVASAAPVTLQDAMSEPDNTLIVVDAPVLVMDGHEPLVCTSELTGPPPSCDGIPAPELFIQDDTPVLMSGVFVARPNGGALTDIAYVGERTVSDVGAGNASAGEVGDVPATLVTRDDTLLFHRPGGVTATVGPPLGATDRPDIALGADRAFVTVTAGGCGHDVVAVPFDGSDAEVVESSAVAPSVSPSSGRLAVIREDECEPTGLVEVGDIDGSGAVTFDLNDDGDGLPFTALDLAWAADDRLLILARMGEAADSYSYWVIEYRIDGSTAEYRRQAYTDEPGSTWLAVAADSDDGFYALASENGARVVRHVVFTTPGEPTESTIVADLGEFEGGDIAYDPGTDSVAVASTTMFGAGLRVVSGEQVTEVDVPGQGVSFVP